MLSKMHSLGTKLWGIQRAIHIYAEKNKINRKNIRKFRDKIWNSGYKDKIIGGNYELWGTEYNSSGRIGSC